MDFRKILTKKGMIFILAFSILVFIGDKVNFAKLVGVDNQFFTLFQFFGPIAGAFLGPVVGVISVLIAELGSFLLAGKEFTLVNILRLTPMLFAAWYFGTKKDKAGIIVPVLAIIIFLAHPVGMASWFVTLLWVPAIIIKLLPARYSDNMLLKSLGSTLTAHSVGGAMWNYVVPMTPAAWAALMPIMIVERLIFASGIAGSYVTANTLLDMLSAKTKAVYININRRYVLFAKHKAEPSTE